MTWGRRRRRENEDEIFFPPRFWRFRDWKEGELRGWSVPSNDSLILILTPSFAILYVNIIMS